MTHFFSDPPVILAVDDNPLNLQLISSLLSNNGFKVIVANSGENAQKYLSQKNADLILLDIMMPDMSGFDVCKTIKQNSRLETIPVIFLTAKNEVDDIVQGFRLGAVDYITKPFHSEEVLIRVKHHIELCRSRREIETKNKALNQLASELEKQNKIIQQDAEKLSKLNAEKDKLFSIVSHDLRGPFAGCMAATDLLSDSIDSLSRDEIAEFAKALKSTANQMNNLLENLLRWAQLQMGAIQQTPENINIKLLFEEVAEAFQSSLSNKNIALELNCNEQLHIHADRNMAMSILRNLLSNAIKFTPRKGTIIITAGSSKMDDMTVIAVADNGIGMNKEMMDRLFKIDEKVSRRGTDGEPSTGLGLSLSADLAKKMGGSILVESAEGKGSTFSLLLPKSTN